MVTDAREQARKALALYAAAKKWRVEGADDVLNAAYAMHDALRALLTEHGDTAFTVHNVDQEAPTLAAYRDGEPIDSFGLSLDADEARDFVDLLPDARFNIFVDPKGRS